MSYSGKEASVDITQLQYFATVAKYSSVTKAAYELHIAQPSLSQSIAKLESELGVTLFERSKKKLVLNTYGELYLDKVLPVLDALDNAKQELIILKQTLDSPLVIKVWRSSTLCSKIIAAFMDRYPYINLKVIQEDYENLSPLETGVDYDIALVSGVPSTMPPYPSEIIFQEDILLAVNRKHPMADKNEVNLSHFKDDSFILLPPERPFAQMIFMFCEQAGFVPKISIENDSAATLLRMIKLNLGVGFVAGTTWNVQSSDDVKLLHISSPMCVRAVSISRPNSKPQSYASQLFENFAKSYFISIRKGYSFEC